MQTESTYFHRQFPLESFKKFLGPEILAKLRKTLGSRRRKRLLGLEGFLWLGILVSMHAIYPSLREIFNSAAVLASHNLTLPLISVSAFCQYRAFFPLKTLTLLWRHLAHQAYQSLKASDRLWHGLRVFAVDGTALNLPEALWPRFGAHSGCRGVGPAQSRAVFAYDVLARVPVKARTGDVHADERTLLKRLFHTIARKGTLILLDTGFYAFDILSFITSRLAHFIIPMRSNGKPKLIESFSENDGLYQIRNKKRKKTLMGLPDTLMVRMVTVYRPGFRPRRIVTSLLDPVAFPPEQIALLYHERWHIETFFREFKHTLHAQHWHAQNLHAFYTELIFLMILVCLTRLAMADSGACPSKLSFSQSLPWVKRMLTLAAYVPVHQWAFLYRELLQQLKTCTIDIRPDRCFERNAQKRRKHRRLFTTQPLQELQHAA